MSPLTILGVLNLIPILAIGAPLSSLLNISTSTGTPFTLTKSLVSFWKSTVVK